MDSPTPWPCLFLYSSHEYTLVLLFEGSAVQNSNRVSVFELSPPLFDIGSEVATRGASSVAVLRRHPSSVELQASGCRLLTCHIDLTAPSFQFHVKQIRYCTDL